MGHLREVNLMRIAVSTIDGKTICGQLGKCSSFIMFESDEFGIKNRELREQPESMSVSEMDTHGQHGIGMLQDCQAVITQGMGRGIFDGLFSAGIIPVITMENEPETAVKRFMSGGTPLACRGNSPCGEN